MFMAFLDCLPLGGGGNQAHRPLHQHRQSHHEERGDQNPAHLPCGAARHRHQPCRVRAATGPARRGTQSLSFYLIIIFNIVLVCLSFYLIIRIIVLVCLSLYLIIRIIVLVCLVFLVLVCFFLSNYYSSSVFLFI